MKDKTRPRKQPTQARSRFLFDVLVQATEEVVLAQGYSAASPTRIAEKAGVKLAMHPDDPPLSPVRGVPRIIRSLEAYDRLLELVPSSANGIALCQGNFTLMTDDLPQAIRRYGGMGKIFFVHFRDVRGTVENYQETFHDDGKTDMAECMRAYRDIGYDGVCRPDHVPTMTGDSNDRPGYSSIGRLFAIGYLRGLMHAI